jgi:hypothetical protein
MTPLGRFMTMRKQSLAYLIILATVSFLVGCSTPGPLHLYSIAPGSADVHDVALATDSARDIPSYLDEGDVLTGFAYDPFTDHFFLRLAPGNRIRVVDRPARKIKREFVIEKAPTNGGGDLAASPVDGHLFLIDSAQPTIIETSRLGELIREITLVGQKAPAAAIAFDPAQNELILLDPDAKTIQRATRTGNAVSSVVLDRTVRPSLAFDPVQHELYAPLAESPGVVGVFDQNGHCVRTVTMTAPDRFIDVGPHSFLRVF